MDERGAGLTEMVVYFATGNLSPSWPRSLSTNFAQDGGRVADGISGGDVYFARGGPRDPHAALPRKRAVHKTSGMTWSALSGGGGWGRGAARGVGHGHDGVSNIGADLGDAPKTNGFRRDDRDGLGTV